MVNASQLAKLKIGPEWVDALNETFQRFNIHTVNQQASFLGQCGHECGNFRILEENLNYKAATLMKLWPRRFPTLEVANAYAGNPKKIANMVIVTVIVVMVIVLWLSIIIIVVTVVVIVMVMVS